MAPPWSYDRLPSITESTTDQDITDYANGEGSDTQAILRSLDSPIALRPLSYRSTNQYTSVEQDDNAERSADRVSLRSFDTTHSAASGSSFGKLKSLGARIRRKPLPRYLKGSVRRHPAAELEPTRIGRGLWNDQLLSDRSLRGMAALMVVLAFAMIILVASYARFFTERANKNTSSVGGDIQSCKKVTTTNTVFLLLINVCATMVLGMSNTYQQLVTSLKISDLKHVLSKFGDSRVGTNSPFSIKHKKDGKKRAWAAWFLLITTSMPVHFLANSLIGPSYTQQLPSVIEFKTANNMSTGAGYLSNPEGDSGTRLSDYMSFPCWSAFRTGKAHFPLSTEILKMDSGPFSADQSRFSISWGRMVIHYNEANCSASMKTATIGDLNQLENAFQPRPRGYYGTEYREGNCVMGSQVYCTVHDPTQAKCRLNVRMSAAFILMGCLILKATYMVGLNLVNRGKPKTHCLTFGDVIVASASNPELRIQGECMVNSGDSFRRLYSHTCHKHCFNTQESKTGDEIGHCQKCKKWNSMDKFANLPQPTITTKIKKSLISNLGSTALTQMCLLMFCSLAMLGGSLALAVPIGAENEYIKSQCKHYAKVNPGINPENLPRQCRIPAMERFEQLSGGFGGFNRSIPIASLPPGSLSNEFISFSVSNGAQFIYSLLYLMLIYNITLISQEYDWGKLEYSRKRIRTTIVAGRSFNQDYILQLPKKVLFPIMIYSVLTHWMLGEALQTQESIWLENADGRHVEHSRYSITYAAYPLWIATFLMLLMTAVCWWAFTYKRDGFMPQMFGSVRVVMAATTQLDDFPENGIQWGDLGHHGSFRHAGLSAEDVMTITPNDIYAGCDDDGRGNSGLDTDLGDRKGGSGKVGG